MPRSCSRFVESLTDDDREYLIRTWRTHPTHAARARAHAILLSANGFSVPELSSIFSIDDDTARSWLKRWDERGRGGLEDEPRTGGPFKLDEKEREQAIELLRKHRNNPRIVIKEIEEKTGKSISRRTLNRWARAARLRWKRFGKSLKKQRDPELFAAIKQELEDLRHEPGVTLAYFDEATFSLTGVVPYGWQEIGERMMIDLSGARNTIHVLGIEEPNEVKSYIHRGSINGATIASILDQYADEIEMTTALVLDNASPHTCKLVQDKQPEWEEKGLVLVPLPAYSPELNDIERIWKDIKYTQLPITAWGSLSSLLRGLKSAFSRLGRTVLMPSIAGLT